MMLSVSLCYYVLYASTSERVLCTLFTGLYMLFWDFLTFLPHFEANNRKNETKNIFLKLQVDCENKLNQAINQTKQDFAKQLKTQELQYYKNNINLYEEY